MKFDAQAHLDQFSGDALRALNALHQKVEQREGENFDEREKVRKLTRDLENAQKQPEGKVLIDQAEHDLLISYKALGEPTKLSKLADDLAAERGKVVNLQLKTDLISAGVPDKYIEKALKLINVDPDDYIKRTGDEVEFNVDAFVEAFPMFVDESSVRSKANDNEDEDESSNDEEEQDEADTEDAKPTKQVVRVVGGKRNKETSKSSGLRDTANKMVQQDSYLPAVLINRGN